MNNSSSDNVKKLNSINRRMFITGSLKFFIMIGIVSRLFFLQVKENKKYLTLSDKNRIREWKLPPVRGEFLDYFGLQHLRELPELPSLPDLNSLELQLPIEEPEIKDNPQTLS